MAFRIFLDQTIVRIIDTSGKNEPIQYNPTQVKYYVKKSKFIFYDGIEQQDFNNQGFADFRDQFNNSFATEADFIDYLNGFINRVPTGTNNRPGVGSDVDHAGRFGANTVFGDRISATRHSTIAAQFQYGVQSGGIDTVVANGGSVDLFESMLRVSTSTNAAGSARTQSAGTVRYVPGQEVYAFFTAVYSPAKLNSYQRVGLFDDSNGFFVGYEGETFTFSRRRSGVDHSQNINLLDFSTLNRYALDPTKGNTYKISYGYLGFAPITLEVMTPDGGYASLAKIAYPNSETETHTTQTFLPVRGEVGNTGNNTNMSVSSGSIAAGIVKGDTGGEDATARSFSWANEVTFTISGNTELVTFRNKDIFNGITNYVQARLLLISGANELNKTARWKLYKNPALTVPGTWVDVKTGDSILEYSLDAEIDFAADNELYLAWNVFRTADFFEKVEDFVLDLPPGGVAVFAIEATGPTSGDADLSIRWKELF